METIILLQCSGILFFFFFFEGNIMDLLVRIQVHARNQEGPMQGTFGSSKPAKHKQIIYILKAPESIGP